MGNGQKFRVIEKSRKIVTYSITDSEMDTLGTYTRIEQFVLNAFFSFLGVVIGTLVTMLSDKENISNIVWIVFVTSLILTALLGLAFVILVKIVKKVKNNIRQ
jgi:hypothetical protein